MPDRKYEISIDGIIIASNMNIQTATILVKALFEEYYNERLMIISINEMDQVKSVEKDFNYMEE